MNRRNNLKLLFAGTAGFILENAMCQKDGWAQPANVVYGGYEYIFLRVLKSYEKVIPQNMRVPFGWSAFAVGNKNNSAILAFDSKQPRLLNRGYKLRFAVSVDSREVHKLKIEIPTKQIVIGEIDIKYSPVLQMYECTILPVYFSYIIEYGIEIFLAENRETPLWLFNEAKDENGIKLVFQPHILSYKRKRISKRSFFDHLFSMNSIQPFGWMEGCVLDALWHLDRHKTFTGIPAVLEAHLNSYFKSKNLIYEDSKSVIADGKLSGIESTLPFATLAMLYPNHPALEEVVAFWQNKKQKNGLIIDGKSTTAEGCYTVAYPMAVIGKLWSREDLILTALQQLRLRTKRLIFEEEFYLRNYENGERTYKNWARGVAWYLLGFARTLIVLYEREDIEDLKIEFLRASQKALSYQKRNGLWNCYMDEDDSKPDTSGSAGIAAAIAAGTATGLLPFYYSTKTEITWEGLMSFLTPDGFLSGVAQSNRGGEELQKSDYRVISQMGMGLMGQLYAYL